MTTQNKKVKIMKKKNFRVTYFSESEYLFLPSFLVIITIAFTCFFKFQSGLTSRLLFRFVIIFILFIILTKYEIGAVRIIFFCN